MYHTVTGVGVTLTVGAFHGTYRSLHYSSSLFFFQAEDGIRDLVRSRGLGDVYKRQAREVAKHIAQALEELAFLLVWEDLIAGVPHAVTSLSLIHI